jgi:hypothetical protein
MRWFITPLQPGHTIDSGIVADCWAPMIRAAPVTALTHLLSRPKI